MVITMKDNLRSINFMGKENLRKETLFRKVYLEMVNLYQVLYIFKMDLYLEDQFKMERKMGREYFTILKVAKFREIGLIINYMVMDI